MAKAKRGRLSSIDLLPNEAEPHVLVALRSLADNNRTQDEIRKELNSKIKGMKDKDGNDVKPICKSSFNRRSLKVAAYGDRISQARQISEVMMKKVEEEEGDVGLFTNDMIRTLVFDVMMDKSLDDSSPSMKMLNEAALTLQRLEKAREISLSSKGKYMREFAAKASDIAEEVAAKAGVSPEKCQFIRDQLLGMAPQ